MNTEQLTLDDYARTTRQSIRSKTTRAPITSTDIPASPKPRKKRRSSSSATEQPKPDGLVHRLNHTKRPAKYYKTTRKRVIRRDESTCQYCGHTSDERMIVEHVIPASRGGCDKPYNLVTACYTCNNTKVSQVWIPRNIEALRKLNKRWATKITELAHHDSNAAPTYPRWSIKATTDRRIVTRVFNEKEAIETVLKLMREGASQLDVKRYDKVGDWRPNKL